MAGAGAGSTTGDWGNALPAPAARGESGIASFRSAFPVDGVELPEGASPGGVAGVCCPVAGDGAAMLELIRARRLWRRGERRRWSIRGDLYRAPCSACAEESPWGGRTAWTPLRSNQA